MRITLMVVPGKIAEVDVFEGATVLQAAEKAKALVTDVDWVGLARAREVRVNKKKFSNVAEVDAATGYAGSIVSTPLEDGDIVLILTKIKGNDAGVLTCTINDQEYALETPDKIANILKNVAGINPADVVAVKVDGEDAHLEDLVGDGDYIVVKLVTDAPEAVEPVILIAGEEFEAHEKLSAIAAILAL